MSFDLQGDVRSPDMDTKRMIKVGRLFTRGRWGMPERDEIVERAVRLRDDKELR